MYLRIILSCVHLAC